MYHFLHVKTLIRNMYGMRYIMDKSRTFTKTLLDPVKGFG